VVTYASICKKTKNVFNINIYNISMQYVEAH
jgi:hypothetical protein